MLGWIKTQPNALKTLVANRISKIQGLTTHATWHHVPSEDNQADLLFREIPIDRLIDDDLWWHGPKWMTDGNPWPERMETPETVLPELESVTVTLTTTVEASILDENLSYRKLTRVVAYCLRWRNRSTAPGNCLLTVEELDKAEKNIVRMVQRETFAQEIRDLENDPDVHRKSKLRGLDPVLDNEGLIRVGGRLRNAAISEDQKHQLILPPRHYLTNLIMNEKHLRLHHCPPTQLLSTL